jgi:hypothetical protein
MKTDRSVLFETILIFLYLLGGLSTFVYFLHSLVLMYSQHADIAAELQLFL